MINDDHQIEIYQPQLQKMMRLKSILWWALIIFCELGLVLRVVYEFTKFNSQLFFVLLIILFAFVVLLLVSFIAVLLKIKHLKKIALINEE